MSWQRIAYGTIVAAGVATTGALWFARDQPTTPRAVDMIEIRQAAWERAVATRYAPTGSVAMVTTPTGSVAMVTTPTGSVAMVTTQAVAWMRYDAQTSGAYWVASTTGGVALVTNYYAQAAGMTNRFDVWTNATHGQFGVVPPAWVYQLWTNTGAKYVRGPFEWVDVAGLVSSAGAAINVPRLYFGGIAANALYPSLAGAFTANTRATRTAYTNSAGARLYDFGGMMGAVYAPMDNRTDSGEDNDEDPLGAQLWVTYLGSWYHFSHPWANWTANQKNAAGFGPWEPWTYAPFIITFIGNSTNVSVTVGPLASNRAPLDAWCTEPEIVRNAVLPRPFMSDIRKAGSALRAAATRDLYARIPESDGDVFTGWTNLPTWGTTGPLDWYPYVGLARTSTLWTAIGTIGDGAVRWSYEMTNAPDLSRITTNTLRELYAVATNLQWTVPHAISWSSLGQTNSWWWQGESNTWEGAKLEAENAIPSMSVVNQGPQAWTHGQRAGTEIYIARAVRRTAHAIIPAGLATNMSRGVDFYWRPEINGAIGGTTGTHARVFGMQGDGSYVNDGTLQRWLTDSNTIPIAVTSSVPFGVTNFPPVWCAEPMGGTSQYTSIGYAIGGFVTGTGLEPEDGLDAVIKWTFQYAEP